MAELLKALPKIHSYQQARQFHRLSQFKSSEYETNVAGKFSIIDATMSIPIDTNRQLCFFIHRYRSTTEVFLDIRYWVKSGEKFIPTKQGIRIPIKFITQILQRITWLGKKYGRE